MYFFNKKTLSSTIFFFTILNYIIKKINVKAKTPSIETKWERNPQIQKRKPIYNNNSLKRKPLNSKESIIVSIKQQLIIIKKKYNNQDANQFKD